MSNTPSVDGEIVVDGRGRTLLDKVRTEKHTRYRVEEFPGGVLVLTPLVTVPAAELDEHTRTRLQAKTAR